MAWSRTSRHDRGYGTAWDKIRIYILRRDRSLCQPCLKNNRTELATQVDHIIPKAKGGTDDESNLQAICGPCHDAKTAQDSGRTLKPKVTFGTDGWPTRGRG